MSKPFGCRSPPKIALFESPLLYATFAILRHFGHRVGPISAVLDECVPRLHAAGPKRGHKIPQRGPGDVVGETGIPRDRDAERQMLVEIEIAVEPSFHERKGPRYRSTRRSDFVHRMGRLELHPVDPSLLAVSPQPRDRVLQCPVEGIASIALRHHDEIRIKFVLHVDRRAIAGNCLIEWYDLHARALRLALTFDRLVVDAYPGDAGADAPPHHAAH